MTFNQSELLILLESLNHFQSIEHDDMFVREITELRERIRKNFFIQRSENQ